MWINIKNGSFFLSPGTLLSLFYSHIHLLLHHILLQLRPDGDRGPDMADHSPNTAGDVRRDISLDVDTDGQGIHNNEVRAT